MDAATHEQMHHDHVRWHSEDDFWRDEVTIWQHEIEEATKDIPRLEEALRRHADAINRHAASIRLYEQKSDRHEHLLTSFEKGESPQELIELAKSHSLEAAQHDDQRKAHEDFKRHQHSLITKWRLLVKALLEAEARP